MMKLKLKQRIAIEYYKIKFGAIALVSQEKAAEKIFDLFCTPYSGKPKVQAPPVFEQAEKLTVQVDGLAIKGWYFKPSNSNGKKILIAHGFDSYSYKFEKYVMQLQEQRFEVLAFDAPAHGISDGNKLNVLLYKKVMLAINKQHGALYGIMAHSVGGLAAAVTAEEMPGLQKLVLIAPATETVTAIENFINFLQLGNKMKQELIAYTEKFAQLPISYFSVARAVENIAAKTLWLHDTADLICPIKDVQPAIDKQLPHVHFSISKGLGHNKIYRDKNVAKQIISFFANN